MQLISKLDSQLFASAFDSVDVGMLIHDENGIIIEFNSAMERISGFSCKEMVGQDCRFFFTRTFCDKSCSLCEAIESKESINNFEAQIIRKNGGSSRIRLDAFPFYDHDELYFLVTLKDVTEIHRLKKHVGHVGHFQNIVGNSKAIKGAFDFVHSMAKTDITLLIIGATGTGKELAASAIHHHGPRKNGPFIAVNCVGLVETLIESELFGHVKGAFTGATTDRIGRFEAASGGTIFLDEIGEVSLQFQAKLLRVLQEKEIERVGDHRLRKVDVRVLAATNKDLLKEVRKGRFREDLYYRLAGGVVHMPLLKERKEDIPILVSAFISKFGARYKREITGVTTDLMSAMISYHWPGNIRELYNLMENAVVMCKAKVIGMDCVPPGYFEHRIEDRAGPVVETGGTHKEIFQETSERERIITALEANRYKISGSAKLLGISRTTLWRKMKTLGIK